jgi:hypothetical protein
MATVFAAACGPRRLALPAGDGESFPDYAAALQEATAACRPVRTLSAELAISGRAGREKLRARVLAGFSRPGSIRLEGVAPFGPPVFILVAAESRATLLLPRDNRVLTGVAPSDVLHALVGLDLSPQDLLDILAGCAVPDPQPSAGHSFAGGWARVDLSGGAAIFLQRQGDTRWAIRAATRPPLRIEYEGPAGAPPLAVRLSAAEGSANGADLRIALSQVELNASLAPEVFSVKVPADATPITLAELRQAGPMGERR